jgi:6-phosphogluconate dehydrogenase
VDDKGAQAACCDWVGEDGAGHFVKMVHNGIEYGDMQLICEVYQIMKDLLGMDCDAMQKVFAAWNDGELKSYLIEITRDILGYKDADGSPLVENILDTAGQKGTGKWATIAAANEGVPLTLIAEAVFARCLSAQKDERVKASKIFNTTANLTNHANRKNEFVADLEKALYASKIVSYAQGFGLMREAAEHYNWKLNYGGVALMWRGGCIIRSRFLGKIKDAYTKDPTLENLLLDPFFAGVLKDAEESWRRVVSQAVLAGIPVPALSSALAWFDGVRCARLPANLLQAQRDYFGAHTYERVDKPRGQFFHTNWTGRGGTTSAETYTV